MNKILSETVSRAGRIFRILCIILLVAMLGLVVYIMTCNFRGKTADIFGRSIMKVLTGSMEPSIHSGDYILINKVDPESLKTGDIICFYSTDSSIYGLPNTHRIVGVAEDGSFITKGDANTEEDSTTVTADRIIGIYGGKVRLLRWINSFASPKKLLMVAVIIPMMCIAVYEVVTIGRLKEQVDIENEATREEQIREAIDREKERLYRENFSGEAAEENTGESEVAAEDESGKNIAE